MPAPVVPRIAIIPPAGRLKLTSSSRRDPPGTTTESPRASTAGASPASRARSAPPSNRNRDWPMATVWPSAMSAAAMRIPSMKVPFRLPRSESLQAPGPTGRSSAWCPDTRRSPRTRSLPGSRPIRTTDGTGAGGGRTAGGGVGGGGGGGTTGSAAGGGADGGGVAIAGPMCTTGPRTGSTRRISTGRSMITAPARTAPSTKHGAAPTGSTVSPSDRRTTRSWRRDTRRSGTATSASSPRPTRMTFPARSGTAPAGPETSHPSIRRSSASTADRASSSRWWSWSAREPRPVSRADARSPNWRRRNRSPPAARRPGDGAAGRR